MVNQVLNQGDPTDETKRRRLLALTGWNCKKMAKESHQNTPQFYLECVSCFFKVHNAQLYAAHFDLEANQKLKESGYSFEFDPLNLHMKHCFFNHSVA